MKKFWRLIVVLTLFGLGATQRTAQAQEAYLGEVKIVAFNFPPRGWASCDGQLLPINQNQALFSLLGTLYGGDGRTTFALPDLRGRSPLGRGQGPGLTLREQGESQGHETVTLTVGNLPSHTHQALASSQEANSLSPAGAVWATKQRVALYSTANPTVMMSGSAIGSTGNGEAVDNMPPYLVLHFIIALQGIFPSRN